MSLRHLALQTLLPAFPGHRPPLWASRLVEEGLGGFALFGYNIADNEQVAALTRTLREARASVIVATDEEGGDVTRLCYGQGSPYPGNAALGAVDDVTLTRDVYAAIGTELASVGITLDMAPAVDVNTAHDNPAIGTRSFGADAQLVAKHAMAAVTGLQEAGVAACAKHFPGHGATSEDSHHELPVVDAPEEVLWVRELPPFQAAVAVGVRAIMTAHIRVPALTGGLAATFSPTVLIGLLRGQIGFTGAVVSDGLEMRGASGHIGVPEAAVRALIAGNDLLCFGGEIGKKPEALDLIEATVAAIIGAVGAGRLSEDRLYEAAARNALLAAIVPPGDSAAPVGDPALGLAAARRALHVEGTVPRGAGLVVQLESPASVAVGEVPWGLPSAERLPTVDSPTAAAATLAARGQGGPVVVVSRDTHRHPWARSFVETLADVHPCVVLVEMGWPSAWRPAGAVGYVATYGGARANATAVAELL